MGYLFFQILIWILLAFGLGGIIGWLLRGFTHAFADEGKGEDEQSVRGGDHIMMALLKSELSDYKKRIKELEAIASTPDPAPAPTPEKAKKEILDAWRPTALPEPKGVADDLKKVRGIGPKIEKTLNDLGIYHYYQIAALDEENIAWLNNHLHFPGRIEREQWVQQTREFVQKSIEQPETV
jgi:predicted flap endonuclease-1-like 5' DNA nuclease